MTAAYLVLTDSVEVALCFAKNNGEADSYVCLVKSARDRAMSYPWDNGSTEKKAAMEELAESAGQQMANQLVMAVDAECCFWLVPVVADMVRLQASPLDSNIDTQLMLASMLSPDSAN